MHQHHSFHPDQPMRSSRAWNHWAAVPRSTLASVVVALVPMLACAANPPTAQKGQAPAQQRVAVAAAPARVADGDAVGARQELASVTKLKTEAFDAARAGQFDRTNELLARAAAISHDPSLARMAEWTNRFESQRKEFAAERRKQYDKEVANVRKLLDNKKDDYAIDVAASAFGLADDKQAFRSEKWVDDLIKQTVRKAEQYDKAEQWLRSLRLYSDLAAVEPANPLWKERLKAVTRRVRLLALYTPDTLKVLQDADSKDRDEVKALLKSDEDKDKNGKDEKKKDAAEKVENDAFRIDWRETLRGVKMDMLWDALVDARDNYFREVDYKKLGMGGLEGVRSVVATKGLEKAFPLLADSNRRAAFLRTIDEQAELMKSANESAEAYVLRGVLSKLRNENKGSVQLPEEVLWSEFADGAFAELDPFTGMIWPSDLDEFNKTTQGEFSGVGIQIQLDEDGSLKVVSPLEDSPAYKAGIKAGDVVEKINGKNAKGISLNQAVKTITGPKGTTVVLTVRSPSD